MSANINVHTHIGLSSKLLGEGERVQVCGVACLWIDIYYYLLMIFDMLTGWRLTCGESYVWEQRRQCENAARRTWWDMKYVTLSGQRQTEQPSCERPSRRLFQNVYALHRMDRPLSNAWPLRAWTAYDPSTRRNVYRRKMQFISSS